MHECACGEPISEGRAAFGYETCLACGERDASKVNHCIAPMAKSNYVVVSNPDTLKQLNKYSRS